MEPIKISLLAGVFFFAGCTVSMQELSLDDVGIVPLEGSDGFDYFRSRQVFVNSTVDVWGLEKDACKEFTSVPDEGNGQAIKLQWNKSSCDWVGFGIGWDGWSPKDLSSITESGAFFFDVKAVNERATIPTLIFLLEDYGGKMSAGVVGSHCMERYPIDSEWQEFQLTLDRFDLRESGIDLTNIKQLVIEFQGAGDIIIDNIRIGPKKDRDVSKNKRTFPSSKVPMEPTVLFETEFQNVWGLGAYEQRNFQMTKIESNTVLDLEWRKCSNCKTYEMGFSWAKWKAVDASDFDGYIELEVKNKNGNSPSVPLFFNLQSYDYSNKSVQLTSEWVEGGRYDGQWRKVRIPLSEFTDFINESGIKQLQFQMKEEGNLLIDNMRIVAK